MTALTARFAPTFVTHLPAEQQGRLDAARDLIAYAQSTYMAAVWPALLRAWEVAAVIVWQRFETDVYDLHPACEDDPTEVDFNLPLDLTLSPAAKRLLAEVTAALGLTAGATINLTSGLITA